MQESTTSRPVPIVVEGEEMLIAGLSERFNMETRGAIPDLWRRFVPYLDSVIPEQVGASTFGVGYNRAVGGAFDYLCGVRVQGAASALAGLVTLHIPAARYAVFTHTGHISGLSLTWQAIATEWLPSAEVELSEAPNFELYTEAFDPASGMGPVEIWLPLKTVHERPTVSSQDNVDAPLPALKTRSRMSLGLWARDLVLSVVVSAFIIVFLYRPVRVEGTSMLPSLEDQDRLFINEFAFKVGEIRRGDVVVFRYPRDREKSYIKRVIGLPGDRISIDHGEVILNGKPLSEPYVPLRFTDDHSQSAMTIPANEFFVMGDHRSISSDSREFGPVGRDLIYGKASFVYWPVDQAGVVR